MTFHGNVESFLLHFDEYVERLRILNLDGMARLVARIHELLILDFVELLGEDYASGEVVTDDALRIKNVFV